MDSDKADKSISKTGRNADGLSKKLSDGIKTAAKWGAALGTGAAVAVSGMVALGIKVGNTADELLDLNSITGMSTDSIQQWRKVTEVAGVSADAMTNASQKLTKSLDTMSEGSNKGNQALVKLGLSLDQIENMSADERMNVLTEALAGVNDKTERARLGTDLFGGSWKEIAPVVDLGTEAMNKAKESANIISEDNLKKANDFRIKVADMKEQVGFFVTEIGIGLMPMLTTMATWIQDKMPIIKATTENAFEIAGTAIKNVSNFVDVNLTPIFKSLFNLIMDNKDKIEIVLKEALDILNLAFDGLKKAVQFVIDNMNILMPIIAGVTAAVLAQMVINGLVSAYKTWQTVTKTQTTLQWLLNAALNANPLGLVAIAIGAVIAAGVLLWKNWDTVTEKLSNFWKSIKGTFGDIKSFVMGVFGDMSTGVKGFINSIIRAMNSLIRGLNKVRFSVPDWVPVIGGKGWGFSLPTIPAYAKGTDYHPGGMALVGEEGPELVNLPKGSSVKTASETASMGNNYITNITVQGNIDKDLYDKIMRKQKNDFDTRLTVAGVRL